MQRYFICGVLVFVLIGITLLPPAWPVHGADIPYWQTADTMRDQLFQAQADLLGAARADDPQASYAAAVEQVLPAIDAYTQQLQPALAIYAPEQAKLLATRLEAAHQAAAVGDSTRFAALRGAIWTTLLHGSFLAAQAALTEGDTAAALDWLQLREYRQSTKVSTVDNPAAEAVIAVQQNQAQRETALATVGDDLRDTYFFRLRAALNQLEDAMARGYASRSAEWAGLAEGYFTILQADMAAKQSPMATESLAAQFATLRDATLDQDWAAIAAALPAIRDRLSEYQPVALSLEEVTRRSQLLYLFIDLVYIEYKDGVRNGAITIETEYREALTFRDQAEAFFQELRPRIAAVDAEAAEQLALLLSEMEDGMLRLDDPQIIQNQVETALGLVEHTLGEQNLAEDAEGSFMVIATLLDEMLVDVQNGEYAGAESTRIQAYAIFDAGAELRLLAVAPYLVERIDGLFWQGHDGQTGFAQAIAAGATPEEMNQIRSVIDRSLAEAQQVLATGAEPLVVITNAAIIVFREGFEAVVILSILMASMTGAYAVYRRPMFGGVWVAFVASALTWWIAHQLLLSFSRFGERLEAIVSIIAIMVLLVITNWFFHHVYWDDWISRFNQQKRRLLRGNAGQILGFALLGFTSVYREGFETVLFLQALVLEAGVLVVLQGVVLGMLGVLIAGFALFTLQKKLPVMPMLVLTGVLIGVVLTNMVGATIHVMQIVGWVPVTPIVGLNLPYWMGPWLGVYPTWQTIVGQVLAVTVVIGSYYLARAMHQHDLGVADLRRQRQQQVEPAIRSEKEGAP
jgi:high-affinity iron transporter